MAATKESTTMKEIDINAAAQTGSVPTLIVAIEQGFPREQRIIDDELAAKFLPVGYRALIKLTRIAPLRDWLIKSSENQVVGFWTAMTCRKCYIDDRVTAAVSDGAVKGIVNLGAGLDTRVYRIPILTSVPVWEVDQPQNIAAKRRGIEHALGRVPPHVTLVASNFLDDDLGSVLEKQGYAGDLPTFFIWEAVSQYLSETAVHETFQFLAQAPAGSRIAFTYVVKDFVEGNNAFGAQKFYARIRDLWRFGFDIEQVPGFLEEYGWRMLEDRGYDTLSKQYLQSTGRDLPTMEIERMVYAEKT